MKKASKHTHTGSTRGLVAAIIILINFFVVIYVLNIMRERLPNFAGRASTEQEFSQARWTCNDQSLNEYLGGCLDYDALLAKAIDDCGSELVDIELLEICEPEVTPQPEVSDPIFTSSSGTYTKNVSIKIQKANSADIIYYTLDGSEPSRQSMPYGNEISIYNFADTPYNLVVKAKAFRDDLSPSNTVTKSDIVLVKSDVERLPFGIAGAKGSLSILGMPEGTPLYGWSPTRNFGTELLTLRAYKRPQRNSGSEPTDWWGYDTDTHRIGKNDAHLVVFEDFVRRNRGATWIIGNEPKGQENINETDYAKMYKAYYKFIKEDGIDPTAKFAIAANYQGPLVQSTYANKVITNYSNLYKENMHIDYFNSHVYANDANVKSASVHAQESARRVTDFYDLTHANQFHGGRYKNVPLLLTEFGMQRVTEQKFLDFLNLVIPKFLQLRSQGKLDSFYIYYGGEEQWNEIYKASSLLKGNEPTALGTLYSQKAKDWASDN